MPAPKEIRVTNTLTGKKEAVKTLAPGKLTMYSCGPTVYNLIHVGNLRAALAADLFRRVFERAGYEVNFVRNYTDVDDKIIQKAVEEKTTADAIACKYTTEVERDYAEAGLREPTRKTTVTTHMPEIIAMIEKIIAHGKAYVVPGGEVLFAVRDFAGYGKLSHKNIDDLESGARVEVGAHKHDPLDFALWKPAKPGEPAWESPWGKGRPGWHIECSAMASKWLGARIDVHHGGEDLIFPHHENEIAQSEAASGQAPFVAYWLHSAFVTLSKEKMSKSLGNVFLARDFLSRYGGEVARYLLVTPHYRSIIDFSHETIEQALTGLHRIYEAKATAEKLGTQMRARADLRAEGAWGEFLASCEKATRDIDAAYFNDFNAPEALAALFTLIREFNRTLAEPLARGTPAAVLGAAALIKVMNEDIGQILGIAGRDASQALAEIESIRASMPSSAGTPRPAEAEILAQIEARKAARLAKDFGLADRIRQELEARGVLILDGPGGTTWRYK